MTFKSESVDQYLKSGCGRCPLGGTPDCKVLPWVEVLKPIRKILHESALTEEIKWSVPCYTHQGKNILILSAFKDSVTLSFFRGAEMYDPKNRLEKPGENSRSVRIIRFTETQTVASLKKDILDFISNAIEIETSGKKRDLIDTPLDYPEELIQRFETHPNFEKAFSTLTPGRQRGWLLHFSSAKQSKTKISRIQKAMPKIIEGKGWNER